MVVLATFLDGTSISLHQGPSTKITTTETTTTRTNTTKTTTTTDLYLVDIYLHLSFLDPITSLHCFIMSASTDPAVLKVLNHGTFMIIHALIHRMAHRTGWTETFLVGHIIREASKDTDADTMYEE